MKKTLLLMIFASLLISIVSCEKELMDYQGENSIYFDVRRGKDFRDSSFWARQYYTHVNFIEIVGDTKVKIAIDEDTSLSGLIIKMIEEGMKSRNKTDVVSGED